MKYFDLQMWKTKCKKCRLHKVRLGSYCSKCVCKAFLCYNQARYGTNMCKRHFKCSVKGCHKPSFGYSFCKFHRCSRCTSIRRKGNKICDKCIMNFEVHQLKSAI